MENGIKSILARTFIGSSGSSKKPGGIQRTLVHAENTLLRINFELDIDEQETG